MILKLSDSTRRKIRYQIIPPDMDPALAERLIDECFDYYFDSMERGLDAVLYTYGWLIRNNTPWGDDYASAAEWYARTLEGVAV